MKYFIHSQTHENKNNIEKIGAEKIVKEEYLFFREERAGHPIKIKQTVQTPHMNIEQNVNCKTRNSFYL